MLQLMEHTEETNPGVDITDLNPPYDDYDKPTLIRILSRKDGIIQQRTDEITRLNLETQLLKDRNTSLLEKLTKYNSETNTDRVENSGAGVSSSQDHGAEKPMPNWSGSTNADNEISIGDIVRATAEAELKSQEAEYQNDVDGSEETGDGDGNAGTNSDYVYDASSGYYYHPPTGYYWDPNSGLFYDYSTCTFYQYNETSGEYEVHSQVDAQSQGIASKKTNRTKRLISSLNKSPYDKTLSSLKAKECSRRKPKKRLSRKKKGHSSELLTTDERQNKENCRDVKTRKTTQTKVKEERTWDTMEAKEKEDGELMAASGGESSCSLATDESELSSGPESGEIVSCSSSDVEIIKEEYDEKEEEMPFHYETVEMYSSEQKLYEEAMAENYPPCIRAIVQESEKLCAGTLFILTCAGGTIGRDASKKHAMEIPDIGVSKDHARVDYDYEASCYKVTDLGSQNGTRVNGTKVHQSDEGGEKAVAHGDVLELGLSSKILLHIHKGHETCEECEPGQVQAKLKALNSVKNTHVVLTKEERRQIQKKGLKNIKKKYGLQNSYFENDGIAVSDPNYADKAYLRRKFLGSENDSIVPDSRPASVHCPIAPSNKGHKLLAKMGWTEGQGLGKANAGISEPINVELRLNKSSGLGSTTGHSVSLDHVMQQDAGVKAKRWRQARERFHQLDSSHPAFSNSSPASNSAPDSSNLLKAGFHSIDEQESSSFNDVKTVPSSSLTLLSSSSMSLPSSSSMSLPSSSPMSLPSSSPMSLPSSSSMSLPSSSSSSSLTSLSCSTSLSSCSTVTSTNPKPKKHHIIKWHSGGTEILSSTPETNTNNKEL